MHSSFVHRKIPICMNRGWEIHFQQYQRNGISKGRPQRELQKWHHEELILYTQEVACSELYANWLMGATTRTKRLSKIWNWQWRLLQFLYIYLYKHRSLQSSSFFPLFKKKKAKLDVFCFVCLFILIKSSQERNTSILWWITWKVQSHYKLHMHQKYIKREQHQLFC